MQEGAGLSSALPDKQAARTDTQGHMGMNPCRVGDTHHVTLQRGGHRQLGNGLLKLSEFVFGENGFRQLKGILRAVDGRLQ